MITLILAGALAVAAPQQQIDTTFAVRPGGQLQVENMSGSITVRSWNRSEVRVQAVHESGIRVEIDRTDNRVAVEATGRNWIREVDYTITVPRSFRIMIEGVNTTATVSGIDGDVSIESVNGGVTVTDVVGRVEAETVSGAVVVRNVQGNVMAASSNQNLRLSGITGNIAAEAVNGSITILDARSTRVSAETVNGNIIIESTIRDGGSYTAATANGRITMALPERANATIDVNTFSGRVDTKLPLTIDSSSPRSFRARLGTGSARIELEAFAGTIELVRPADLKKSK